MLITFSGLDGSGKSTLVEYLRESLEKENQKVTVSHMNYDVGIYPAVRLLLKKTLGKAKGESKETHAPREQAYEGKFRSNGGRLRYMLLWNKSLRALIYPFDVLIFLVYRFYVEKLNQRVLIMDRYFYDTLVDVTEAQRSLKFRLLSWLTPAPSLSVYLDVTPEEAYARKNEYSVAYLNQRRVSYIKLISSLPRVLILSTDQDLNTTRLALATAVRQGMAPAHD